MWGKIPIEGAIQLRSHNIPLSEILLNQYGNNQLIIFHFQEVLSCIASHKQDDSFIEQHVKVQERRREALNAACSKFHHEQNNVAKEGPAVSLLIEDYHLLYAQTAKIAGTSWDRVFLVLSHLANDTSRLSQSSSIDETQIHVPGVSNYRREDRPYILQNFTSFMFCRHPFSRLLSAYNCKIGPRATQEHISRGYYDHLRENILKRFPSTGQRGIPDFRSFVQYIIENDYFNDPHWKENYKIVAPCDVKYDIIGHFETLGTDAKFILQSVGADCFVQFPSSEGSAATNSSHTGTLVQSFQTLSKELIERLYEKYRLDFLLFGYTFEIDVDGHKLRFPPLNYSTEFIDTSAAV